MGRRVWWLGVAAALLVGAGDVPAAGPDDAGRRGIALYEAGRYAAALPHLEEAARLAEASWGQNDPRLAAELNNLGEAYRRAGRAEEAEAAFRRAVAIDQQAQPESPALATSLNNLALVLRGRGRLEEAETLYRRSLELLERQLGPHHPDVARGLSNLAALYMRRGEAGRALPVQERAVASARRSLGSAHELTRQLETNLAMIREAAALEGGARPGPPPLPAQPGGRLPPPPSAMPQQAVAPGRFAVHLASVREERATEAEWRRFQRRFPVLADLPWRPPAPVEVKGKGTYWRVIGGALPERAAAEAICRTLEAKRQYCRVVEP
ncbi:tetratricopeptide repeat protein [Geminicoccaceae bacterium 1502E]|nr:tetratricopeptide repeat protein [Geminicoccaceae bacterium 1502E]